jgi:hypothetical protein
VLVLELARGNHASRASFPPDAETRIIGDAG